MASPVPAKSQPLHNFSLPHLKWKNHRSGRSRLAGETSSSPPSPHRSHSPPTPWRESPPPTSHSHIHPQQSSPAYVSRRPFPSPLHKQSPMRGDSESESEPVYPVSVAKPNRKTASEKSTKSAKSIDTGKGNRSNNKICIRFPKNSVVIKHDDAVIEENHSSTPVANGGVPSAAEEDESSPKTWNLRPRRPPMSHKQSGTGSSPLPENTTSHRSKISNPAKAKQTPELKINDNCSYSNPMTSKKHKFSIALSRDEIEEDVFSFTGSKPSRRPKKRSKTVQKQLDVLFPGLWLGSITADTYKVSMQQG